MSRHDLSPCVDPNATYAALDRACLVGDAYEALACLRALTEHIEAKGVLPLPVRAPVQPAIGFPRNLEGRSWHWLIDTTHHAPEATRLEVWCFAENRWQRTTGKTSFPRIDHNEPPPLGWAYHSKVHAP